MAYYNAEDDVETMAERKEFKIYVTNLPLELNEAGIGDIFNQYGKVLNVYHPRNTTWAFVIYETYHEAEKAIRVLDNKKPLYLKVALARDKPMRDEQVFRTSEAVESPVARSIDLLPTPNNIIKQPSIGRGRVINAVPSLQSLSKPIDSYEVEDPYVNTNQLWTRGKITVTRDGRRHVSLGRGYTLYEYPEVYPIEEYISKVYEKRNQGSYIYSQDKFQSALQKCLVCSIKTTKHCAKCHTYYCSKDCQLNDWPRHQAECERIPELVEEIDNDVSSLKIDRDNEVHQTKDESVSNTINKTDKPSEVKLRRPNTIIPMKENSNSINSNIDMHKSTYQSMNNGIQSRCSPSRDNGNGTSETKADQSIVRDTISQHRLHKQNDSSESIDQVRKSNEYSSFKSIDQNCHSRNYQNNSSKTIFDKEGSENDSNVRDRSHHNNKNYLQRNGFQDNKDFDCHNGKDVSDQKPSISNEINFYKNTCLSKSRFTIVDVIMSLGNGEYWVIKEEDVNARKDLMKALQNVAVKSYNVPPVIDKIYGVQSDNTWYRAIVTSLNPVKINFIDYGEDKTLKNDEKFREIGDLVNVSKFAIKIRLQSTREEYKNFNPNDKISVRMLSTDFGNTLIVEQEKQSESSSLHTSKSTSNGTKKKIMEENHKTSNKSTKEPGFQVPNVLNALTNLLTQNAVSELQISGCMQFYKPIQNNVYCVALVPQDFRTEFTMICDDLREDCSKISSAADYKPKVGELVCGKDSEGYWYRGYICSETPNLSIFKIDEAQTQSVEKVLPCPAKYFDICAFGVTCEINNSAEVQIVDGMSACFNTIVNKNTNQENFEIEITTESKKIMGTLKPWKFVTNVFFPINNKSEICLTSYRNHYCMFARSLDEEQVEYYNKVLQTVAKIAPTAPNLTRPPADQEIVIAPFEDGNSYRAMVLRAENDKARIVYIDFGNVDVIDVKDLKAMPQISWMQQNCAQRIFLKDVPHDVPSNPEVDHYIRDLLGKEVPLICTYDKGTSPKDGVRLTTVTGISVNDEINRLLTPNWKKEDSDDNRCYMLNHIETASLGREGDTVNALVLFIQEDDQLTYALGPCDENLGDHIVNVLPKMLLEYSEKNKYYIPRVSELCIALYEGGWYRAACIDPKETPTTATIFFIDFGNVESVEHKNIRLMPKDFIVPAAFASLCSVVNLAPVDDSGKYSKAVQKKVKELVEPNSLVKIKIVKYNSDDCGYKIEMPEIRDKLVKEGLV
ncbi:hypothetical protein PUN28_019894 [Cardiocondyla obscurior]|uniref:Tudor domain-containing protein 1 n=1 Tax=Cardiocondyla obscurior TaxID=286306 RepID=A0AAW2EAR6_9HYME